jgi:two-component system, NtrC family, nitrogen regulation sensor histidine kinase NtrY
MNRLSGLRVRLELGHERRVLLMTLAAALPGAVIALVLLWRGDFTPKVQWTLALVIVACWWGFAIAVRQRVVFPLHTLSNLLAGLREGDASIRARGASSNDALGEVMLEANSLAETIRHQRLGALEATALLRKVMAEIDVAVFTFDAEGRLRLVNRAGQRLLGEPAERLLDRPASAIGLDQFLHQRRPRVVDQAFPGGSGRWEVRSGTFRQGGRPHHLLVLADVSRPLRDEERQAWQRLMRVLGHELNNSLAPIKSIAGSLEQLVGRDPRPDDWEDDVRRGLAVIAARSEALSRFMAAYAQLARLPQPRMRDVALGDLVRRVAGLETRLDVRLVPGTETVIRADADQIEQLLINLIRNAVDAALQTGGGVSVGWSVNGAEVEIGVEDEGPGLPASANLFVPFFTTKPGGTGIGLVLSRQIAEAHGGDLVLENRTERSGCRARLRLPV